MASASNQPLIHPFKLASIGETVRYQSQLPNAASSSKEEPSGYGISQENQEYHARLKLYEDEIKTVYNPRIYQTNINLPNINLPSPPATLILPSEFKIPRKKSRDSLSATSKAGRKTAASGFPEAMSRVETPRIDECKTFTSQLEQQLPFSVEEKRDRKSVAHERQASRLQHERNCMEEGGSLGQEACPIAVLATYVPVNNYKLMMEQHPTRPVVRSSTYRIPPATDYGMLWYLVRDGGCRPKHAFNIVRFVFPDVTRTTQEFAASFVQPGYQESYNYLMDVSNS